LAEIAAPGGMSGLCGGDAAAKQGASIAQVRRMRVLRIIAELTAGHIRRSAEARRFFRC